MPFFSESADRGFLLVNLSLVCFFLFHTMVSVVANAQQTSGDIFNDGTIILDNESLPLTGDSTFTGGGEFQFSNLGDIEIGSVGGPLVNVVNVDNTFSGHGVIYLSEARFINQAGGVLNGNSPGEGFFLARRSGSTTDVIENQGLILASDGGIVELGFTHIDNAGGIIRAEDGSDFLSTGGSISGGTLQTTGTGRIVSNTFGTTLTDLVLDGNLLSLGATITLGGNLENRGVFDASRNRADIIIANRDIELTGGGVFNLRSQDIVGDRAVDDDQLINVDNTINLSGSTNITGTVLTNLADGTLNSFGSSTLLSNQNYGLLTVSQSANVFIEPVETGEFTNSGSISIDGELTIRDGDAVFDSGSVLNFGSNVNFVFDYYDPRVPPIEEPQFGLLEVGGALSLLGSLNVDISDDLGINSLDVIDLITFDRETTDLSNITVFSDGDRLFSSDGNYSFTVNFDLTEPTGRISLTNFIATVPEPNACILLVMATLAVSIRRTKDARQQ